MEFLRAHQEKGAIGYILLCAMGVPVSSCHFLIARLHIEIYLDITVAVYAAAAIAASNSPSQGEI
jgi:hypothetical protein